MRLLHMWHYRTGRKNVRMEDIKAGLRSRGVLGRLRLRSRANFHGSGSNLRGPSDFAWYISWSAGGILSCF
jgi:hypothetical protein